MSNWKTRNIVRGENGRIDWADPEPRAEKGPTIRSQVGNAYARSQDGTKHALAVLALLMVFVGFGLIFAIVLTAGQP